MGEWRLEDVEARQRESPRHYPIPPSVERKGLQPGDLVKLVFLVDGNPDADGERMWVEVLALDDDGFVGTLANQPRLVALEEGAEIRFQPRHVAAIVFEPIDAQSLVIVSRRVLDDAWPNRLVRQPPTGDYSGWQVFAGDEPAGWSQDPANARAVPIAQLLDLFPVLESVFGDSRPGEWRWSEKELEYERQNS
jgi:hypothetical protein